MNTTATDISSPKEKYTALLPTSKSIAQLLAVSIDSCHPDVVMEWPRGEKISAPELLALLHGEKA